MSHLGFHTYLVIGSRYLTHLRITLQKCTYPNFDVVLYDFKKVGRVTFYKNVPVLETKKYYAFSRSLAVHFNILKNGFVAVVWNILKFTFVFAN